MSRFLERLPRGFPGAALLVLCALIYVGNTWSPSSYALALRQFEAEKDGLVLGAARDIRADEWRVITPLTQATVNNGFARYNARSYYGEDLRSTYSMPIFDWGLAFKPTMWLYPLVNAAYAFSFHHFASFALFLIGYAALFRRLGMKPAVAALVSMGLFFTSFTQYWWTTIGPPMAWFPWLLWLFLSDFPLLARLLAFYWAAACWLLSMFYPPLFVPLGFVAVAILLAFAPERLRQPKVLVGFAVAGGLACVTVLLYLQDWLQGTLHTAYPGERRVGGGGFGWDRVLSILLPTARLQRHESLVPEVNICELSVVGSFYFLMVLCFLRWGAVKQAWTEGRLKPLRVLLPAALLMSAWLFLPLPAALGKPLLWHFVPAVRMAFAFGLLLFLLAHTLADGVGLEPKPLSVLLFAGLLVGGWYQYKLAEHGIRLGRAWKDVVVILPVVAVYLGLRTGKLARTAVHPGLLGSAVAVGVLSFGLFNPIQSAWPIFNRVQTPRTRAFDAQMAASPGEPLMVGEFTGALLNGWGYRSASHVLPTPQVERFQRMFPELPPQRVNDIFNRYAHIALTQFDWPALLNTDAVVVPVRAFTAQPRSPRRWITPVLEPLPPATRQVQGAVDAVSIDGDSLVIKGWAPWEGVSPTQGLLVRMGRFTMGASIEPTERPDVAANLGDARYLSSGFTARIPLVGMPAQARDVALCVVAMDLEKGWSTPLATPGLVPCG